jgi:hypothetical protein
MYPAIGSKLCRKQADDDAKLAVHRPGDCRVSYVATKVKSPASG